MKGYKNNFNLLEEENVLVETPHVYDHKGFPFRILGKILVIVINFGLFVGAFFLFTLAFHPSILTFAFLIMGSLLLIIGVLLIPLLLRAGYFSFFRKKRTIFYVTNQRIVELIRKGLFNRKNHFKEIKYNELDYLIKNVKTLSFHKKVIFQVPYYALEDEVYKAEPKEQEKIEIHLEGTKGKKKWDEIKAFLFPMIPLIPHPRLKFIILNKNLVVPKDNL
jgi:hypothetical protein